MTTEERNFLRQLGRNIATKRKEQHLTQKVFAKRAGISTAYVASIEAGRRWPRLGIHYAMAKVLHIATIELFDGAYFESHRHNERQNSPL